MTPPPSGLTLHARLFWRRNRGLGVLYLLLAALLVLYAFLHPGLLSLSGIARFTQNWFPVAVVAIAQTLIMLMGGIDLAIGAMVSLGTVLAATLVGQSVGGALLGSAATIAIGTGIGAVVGTIVAVFRLPAIIVTLSSSFLIGGAALLIMAKPGGSMPDWLSAGLVGEYPTALLLLILLLVLWRVLRATRLGLAIEAPVGLSPAACSWRCWSTSCSSWACRQWRNTWRRA